MKGKCWQPGVVSDRKYEGRNQSLAAQKSEYLGFSDKVMIGIISFFLAQQ